MTSVLCALSIVSTARRNSVIRKLFSHACTDIIHRSYLCPQHALYVNVHIIDIAINDGIADITKDNDNYPQSKLNSS